MSEFTDNVEVFKELEENTNKSDEPIDYDDANDANDHEENLNNEDDGEDEDNQEVEEYEDEESDYPNGYNPYEIEEDDDNDNDENEEVEDDDDNHNKYNNFGSTEEIEANSNYYGNTYNMNDEETDQEKNPLLTDFNDNLMNKVNKSLGTMAELMKGYKDLKFKMNSIQQYVNMSIHETEQKKNELYQSVENLR